MKNFIFLIFFLFPMELFYFFPESFLNFNSIKNEFSKEIPLFDLEDGCPKLKIEEAYFI